ncbi:MAG: hypothetical protein U0165_02700 [Polyangiaceae bacterium]
MVPRGDFCGVGVQGQSLDTEGFVLHTPDRVVDVEFHCPFEPHYSFSKNFPTFGSLFTLLMPIVLMLKQAYVARRVCRLVVCSSGR